VSTVLLWGALLWLLALTFLLASLTPHLVGMAKIGMGSLPGRRIDRVLPAEATAVLDAAGMAGRTLRR
jgi:hypothetical protein